MSHVEFLGPSGSGKTAIYAGLADERTLYRPFLDADEHGPSSRGADVRFHEKVRDAIRFLRRRPTYASVLVRAGRTAAHERGHLLEMLLGTAAQYERAVASRPPERTIVLDEGFLQRALSIRLRTDPDAFDLERYLDAVPLPSVLVHVDAPADVCDARQRTRDKDVLSKPWIAAAETERVIDGMRDDCADIVARLERRDVAVVEIENEGSIDDAIERTQRELLALIDAT